MPGEPIAEQGKYGRLVERGEAAYSVAVAPRDQCGVVAIPADDIATEPPALILERLRQIPMIETEPWLDTSLEKAVDQTIVKGKSGLVRGSAPLGQHARPRDREAIGLDAKLTHQRNVLGIAMVVVTGKVARIPIRNVAWHLAVGVPDARTPSIDVGRAFDLVAGCRHTPHKVSGQLTALGDGYAPSHRNHVILHRRPLL